jgi:hypothetical protein
LLALSSIATGLIPLEMELGTSFVNTRHRKVRKRTDYRCSTSPGSIRVIVFTYSQGKHYDIDNRKNGREDRDSMKGTYSGVTIKIYEGNLTRKEILVKELERS